VDESVAYTPQQVHAIEVALSDPTVKTLIVEPPYYVEFVGSSGNATVTDSYFIQLYQVDGTGVVGAFVNPGLDSVVSSYAEQRVSGECWPDGMFSRPVGRDGLQLVHRKEAEDQKRVLRLPSTGFINPLSFRP
jgi:hypothetical protein